MDQMGQNWAPNIFFSSLVHYYSIKLYAMIACKYVWHLVEVKSTKYNFGARFGQKGTKLGPEMGFSQDWFLSFS